MICKTMRKSTLVGNLNRHHRRNLPHFEHEDAVYFMTVCLKGSLPKHRIEQLKKMRQQEEEHLYQMGLSETEIETEMKKLGALYFGKYDDILDELEEGPHWLKKDSIAQIWQDALFHFNEKRYKVICSTIMSNHVHFIFYQLNHTLGSVMHSLKSYTGGKANQALDRTNKSFWQDENFDRKIRHRIDLKQKIAYVLNNPKKAGLVNNWRDWKWSYIRPEFEKFL